MLTSFVVGVLISAVCALGLRAWARRSHVVQKVGTPLVRQDRELPPVGGMALAIGCVAAASVWFFQSGMGWTDQWRGLLGASAVILIVGFIDDFVRELKPWQKLLGQGLAWALLVHGGIVAQMMLLPSWANLLLSLVWTLVIVNAFNLLDVADGLASGIGLIASGTFLTISLLAGQPGLAGVLTGLCGALLGVFVLNFPRATLFLGDSGSLLLGLLLAAFALAISYAPLGREVALLTPLVVLGLPLYDLAFVTIVRVWNGRSPFKKSQDHFVLRLIRHGFSPTKAVLAVLALCLAFGLTALVISQASNLVGLITFGGVLLVSLWWGVRIARIPTS